MPYITAKQKLASADQTTVDSLLATWARSDSVAQQAVINLQNEYGSDDEKLESYLNELAKNAARLSVRSPIMEFKQVGKTFALAGYEATPYQGAVFGRAMVLESYARYVQPELDRLHCTDTPDVITATIRTLDGMDEVAAPPHLGGYFEAIRKTPLGKGAVFATFVKPVKRGQRPWSLPVPNANAIRSSIALGEDDSGKDYILFAYNLPSGVMPRVPTTASPGWSYQRWFRPNFDAATDLHGWTEPLEPGFARQPEIVHESISGATIVFPIHVANA